LLLLVGLTLVLRNGIVITFAKICCGHRLPINCPLCLFRLDRERFWRHPLGCDVPLTQCLLPTHCASRSAT